ncbi:MAG: NAD-dependent deacylase, partial [Myxococcales bacterium]|nr:NAD-dependent deacylase [Myxococcales bacterium]
TGAGISAESGVPTYRGPGGYWTVGRRANRPTSRAEFESDPRSTWAFHLRCRADFRLAAPNPAHHALARLEQGYGDAMWLITQNIDSLHLRAGSSREQTIELHGSCERWTAIRGPSTFPRVSRSSTATSCSSTRPGRD